MLARTKLRLIAVHSLKDETTPFDDQCGIGPIWVDCNGDPIKIYDSPSGHLGQIIDEEDTKASDFPAIAVYVSQERYSFDGAGATKLSGSFSLVVEIYATSDSEWGAEDTLDAIHERVLYRLFRGAPLTVEGVVLPPLLRLRPTTMTANTERARGGDRILYMRQLDFTVEMSECIDPPECEPIEPICITQVITAPTCGP